jgi:CRISPR/Cas system-associated exonuclease Cas4 (RecB family)
MSLHMSVSSVSDFLTCRRLYYYKRIKKYEKTSYNLPFIVGRVVHEGLAAVLAKRVDPKTKKPNAIEIMTAVYKKERLAAIKEYVLSPEQLEELDMQEFTTKGMLLAYQTKYGKMIADMKLLGSEVEGAIDLGNDVTFVVKLDNIVKVRNKKILHELKTTKQITPDYVKRIQTDLQTAVYFHFHNIIWPDEPIEEVMYDVIRKPSIRRKKASKNKPAESKEAFLTRLQEWYKKPDDMSVFHIERFKQPGITEDAVINTVVKVSEEMLRSKDMPSYYQDFDKCHSYYGERCPYYELCHEGGEIPQNMLQYAIRKPFHIDKSNKGVGK